MNPNDRELEKAWQAQALDDNRDVHIDTLDDGRQIMETGAKDEWLVICYE